MMMMNSGGNGGNGKEGEDGGKVKRKKLVDAGGGVPYEVGKGDELILEDIDPNELVQWDKYLVSRGDTLISIAEKYLIDFELLKINLTA